MFEVCLKALKPLNLFTALLSALFLASLSSLGKWRPSTLVQQNLSSQEGGARGRQLEDCGATSWDVLCRGLEVPVGCLRVHAASQTVSSCRLVGPSRDGLPALLVSGGGLLTLETEGDMHITGYIHLKDLRLQAQNLTFEDAQLEAWHSQTSGTADMGGAFSSRGALTFVQQSNVTVRGTRALKGGGCAAGGDLTLTGASRLCIEHAAAKEQEEQGIVNNHGGGLYASGAVKIRGASQLAIAMTFAERGAGFYAEGQVDVQENSLIRIHNAIAVLEAGGFWASDGMTVSASTIELQQTWAGREGGGFWVEGSVQFQSSWLNIDNARAGGSGGGFFVRGHATVANSSQLEICNSHAENDGGAFAIQDSVTNMEGARAKGDQGADLEVRSGSVLIIENASAKDVGGGFAAFDRVLVAEDSRLQISNTCAKGGGGIKAGSLLVAINSQVIVHNATAQEKGGAIKTQELFVNEGSEVTVSDNFAKFGGGFWLAGSLQLANSSAINIQNATAVSSGGGFFAFGDVRVAGTSTMKLSNCHSASDGGGGFATKKTLLVTDSSAIRVQHATAARGGCFYAHNQVEIARASALVVSNCTASSRDGGGFVSGSLQATGSSTINIQNAKAAKQGGGFKSSSVVIVDDKSTISVTNCSAISDSGGGFHVYRNLLLTGSSAINVHTATARSAGGGFFAGDVALAGRSVLAISDSSAATGAGGGFQAASLQLTDSSAISVLNATAMGDGGCFMAKEEVLVDDGSQVSVSNCHAISSHGGGFKVEGGLRVVNGSIIGIDHATAKKSGGGFVAGEVNVTKHSKITISGSRAILRSGGGFSARSFQVTRASALVIRSAEAEESGGGFAATGDVSVSENSTVRISDCFAKSQDGGGFSTEQSLRISDGATVSIQNTTAGGRGGGFATFQEAVVSGQSRVMTADCHANSASGGGLFVGGGLRVFGSSAISFLNASAGQHGGGFYVEDLAVSSSTISMSRTTAGADGGGFAAGAATLTDSNISVHLASAGRDGGAFAARSGMAIRNGSMDIRNTTASRTFSAGRVHGQLLVANGSRLRVRDAEGTEVSSVLGAACLEVGRRSALTMTGALGGHGLTLSNGNCSSSCANRTLRVAEDAALNASGQLGLGLLSMVACPSEVVRMSGIYLHSWSGPLLSTRMEHAVIDGIRIEYQTLPREVLVLAVNGSYSVESLAVSCPNCSQGIAFNASKRELHALSTPVLRCPDAVLVSNGSMAPCTCASQQITSERFMGRDLVPIQDLLQTCAFCEVHREFQNGTCRQCPAYNAWSHGRLDQCHPWPRDVETLGPLLAAAAVCVAVIFALLEVLQAPLVVLEAKSQYTSEDAVGLVDVKCKRCLTISVQGPSMDLPQRLARLVHRHISFRVCQTGLHWLDFDPKKANTVLVLSAAPGKLQVRDVVVPFDCASCTGFLQATGAWRPIALLSGVLCATVILPVCLAVAAASENQVLHVLVTVMYCALPVLLLAAVLHPVVAWLISRRYRTTPFSVALAEYGGRIQCEPHPGPDAHHPRNQGLPMQIFWELWAHFESFILERNMHFIVANIVRPLTRSKQVSFVTLWGGKQVWYFVSHSWGTGFAHFVRSLRSHALSKEGQVWREATYWICSFANNQWDIAGELGATIMDSAFAQVLNSGILKGVAMVLDHEVQPLTRVWCLFEFLLSSQLNLELVFTTDVGVIGDPGCTSFDIALIVGKRLRHLEVAGCQASSDEDKRKIFDFIISSLGSLERMDDQIRRLMRQMLFSNLDNVGHATDGLLQRLGHR